MKKVKGLTAITLCLSGTLWPNSILAQSVDTHLLADSLQTANEIAVGTGENAELPAQWDLRSCIDYALKQNITIRRNKLSAESAQVDVKTAKAALFPSLSASIGQRIVNRPNSETGTIITGDNITSSQSKTSYNGSYGIDANWTLYNGGQRLNNIKQQDLNNRIAELAVAESENSIEETLINEQILNDVVKLIGYLPESQQKVVRMRFFEDLSFKEIADQTGVSINTALGRMRYALLNMRRLAQEHNVALEL